MTWNSYDITVQGHMDHTVRRLGEMTMMMEALLSGKLQGSVAHRRPKVQVRLVEVQRRSRQVWRPPPALTNEFFRGWRFRAGRQPRVGRPRHQAG